MYVVKDSLTMTYYDLWLLKTTRTSGIIHNCSSISIYLATDPMQYNLTTRNFGYLQWIPIWGGGGGGSRSINDGGSTKRHIENHTSKKYTSLNFYTQQNTWHHNFLPQKFKT